MRLIVRLIALVLGCGALFWSYWAGSEDLKLGQLQNLAVRIRAGERFKTEALTRLLAYVDTTEGARDCNTGGMTDAADVRLYAVTELLAGTVKLDVPATVRNARRSLQASLACAPYQSALWFQLFWLKSAIGQED